MGKNAQVKDLISFLQVVDSDDSRIRINTLTRNVGGSGSDEPITLATALEYEKLHLLPFNVDTTKKDEKGKYKVEVYPTGNLLVFTTLIETLTIHLCAIHKAKDFNDFLANKEYYSDSSISQANRLDELRKIYEKSKNMPVLNKDLKYISEVRNQVAHSFSPMIIVFCHKSYFLYDEALLKNLISAIRKSIKFLAYEYQSRIDLLLNCEANKTKFEAMFFQTEKDKDSFSFFGTYSKNKK